MKKESKNQARPISESKTYPSKSYYNEIRTLAKQFVKANPSCIAAVPCHTTNSTEDPGSRAIVVYLYIHTNGLRITDGFREKARKIFFGHRVEFMDLEQEQLGESFFPRDCEDKSNAAEMTKVAEIIEKNISVFKNRLNVTAVYPSYKISCRQETNDLCIAVAVLGKRKIPVNEEIFPENAMLDGYKFDIVEGYFVPTSQEFSSEVSPLRFGVGIGVRGARGTGTLGAFVTDKKDYFLLSCNHVLQKLSDEKSGEGMPGDEKLGAKKLSDEKPGVGMPGDEKLGSKKLSDEKPGEGMPGEEIIGDGKPGDESPSEGKSGGEKSPDEKRDERRIDEINIHIQDLENRDNLNEEEENDLETFIHEKGKLMVLLQKRKLEKLISEIEKELEELEENGGGNQNGGRRLARRKSNEENDLETLEHIVEELTFLLEERKLKKRISEIKKELEEREENGDCNQNERRLTIRKRSQVRAPIDKEILIEQPSAEDYIQETIYCKKEIVRANQVYEYRKRNEWPSRIRAAEDALKACNGNLNEMRTDKLPRYIASYAWGLQRNYLDSVDNKKFFVDAGIAKLSDDERKDILTQTGPLCSYGMKYSNKVVACEEMVTRAEKGVKFWKCGRTTNVTKGASFRCLMCIKLPDKLKPEDCDGFQHIPFKDLFTETCEFDKEEISPNEKTDDENWALNCFVVQSTTKVFAKPGDSGAVMFDKTGDAWAMVVGTYRHGNGSEYTVTSSLDIALKALNEKLGKNLKLWTPF